MKFAYTYLIAYTSVAREFHYLNRSVYSANRWASHKMCQHQQLHLVPRAASRLQIVFNCGHCADRSRADVICGPRFSDHSATQYSGATGSEPMQINNDQSRIETGEPAAGGNAKINFAVSQTIWMQITWKSCFLNALSVNRPYMRGTVALGGGWTWTGNGNGKEHCHPCRWKWIRISCRHNTRQSQMKSDMWMSKILWK